jgi:hypothetical protein
MHTIEHVIAIFLAGLEGGHGQKGVDSDALNAKD